MTVGERLRAERERLNMSQPAFAGLAGTSKQTLFSWERGKTAPDAHQLAAFAEAGVDVLYVVTGGRDPSLPALDGAERVLVDSYRRCNAQAQANLIQTAALLAAGLPSGGLPPTGHMGGSHSQHATGNNNVQIGSIGGKKRSKGDDR